MSKSLYTSLNISEEANASEIKKAYRTLAKKYHPDINKTSEAEEKFKEINAAYEILSDENKKRQYDQAGDNMFGGQNFHDFSQSQDTSVDLNDILNNMFGGGSKGFNNSTFEQHFSNSGNQNFNFNQEVNLDIESEVYLDIDIILTGGKQRININNDSFEIKIPEGIEEGKKLKVSGKGNKNQFGQKGDLYIKVKYNNKQNYERREDDLILNIDVPFKIALFGGKVEIDLIKENVKLKIHENTKNNQKMRIKEKGFKNIKTKIFGDVYVVINIIQPNINQISPELKHLIEKEL